MDKDLDVKNKTINLPEENMSKLLYKLGVVLLVWKKQLMQPISKEFNNLHDT